MEVAELAGLKDVENSKTKAKCLQVQSRINQKHDRQKPLEKMKQQNEQFHRTRELLRLEKTSDIIKSFQGKTKPDEGNTTSSLKKDKK